MKKRIIILVGFMAAVIAAGTFFYSSTHVKVDGSGSADARSAQAALNEGYGDTILESLGDIKEAKNHEDPLKWLVDNSVVTVDEDGINRMVDEYKTGAETTAMASGITYEQMISQLGYASEDEMTAKLFDYYVSFVKERTVAIAVADEKNITVSHKYYEENLTKYAERFGYEDGETFEYECDPDSIANEMLYDKVVKWLRK